MLRMVLTGVLMFGWAFPAAAQARLAFGWQTVLQGCLDYMRSGQRDVFAGWDIAWPGGGVCNDDPVCEGSKMTFIPVGRGAMAAVTLFVPGGVSDAPVSAICRPADGVRDSVDVSFALAALLNREERAGRLWRPRKSEAGKDRFRGCSYDGRVFEVTLSQAGPTVARFTAVLRPAARTDMRCGLAS